MNAGKMDLAEAPRHTAPTTAVASVPARLRISQSAATRSGPVRGDASHARFEGNCYWTLGDGEFWPENHSTFEEWVAATGQEKVGDALVGLFADPLIAGAGEAPEIRPEDLAKLAAYRLQAGSPCAGAGVPVEGSGGRDFWGNPIPEGEKPSIGAWEGP